MKKISSLIIIICLLSLTAGCGNDQFAVEKRYWKLQKQAERIFRNSDATPPRELERTVKAFSVFADRYTNTPMGYDAEFNIARLYIVKEQYDAAREQLKQVLSKYSKSEPISAEAVFLLGNTYELENKWEMALAEYKRIMQDYPLTRRGIDVPIYIASHYKVKLQPEKMLTAFNEARAHYQALSAKYPGTPLAMTTDTLAAECFLAANERQKAIDALSAIIAKYKGKTRLENIYTAIAMIYKRDLKNDAMAAQTLEAMLKEYPDSPAANQARALIKEWSKK